MFGKTSEELWKKYAIIGIDIDIDTRESIDAYQYFPISISIDTFPITIFGYDIDSTETNIDTPSSKVAHVFLSLQWLKFYIR